nr:hypothetical protein [Candidatus Eremiobacteraeota bacterium]
VLGGAGTAAALATTFAAVTVLAAAWNAVDGADRARWFGARFAPVSAYVQTAWLTALVVLTLSITVALNAPAPHIVYRAF